MGLLDLHELQNLKELRNLEELDNAQQLEHLQKLDKLDNLQQLPELHNLKDLQSLQDLHQLQNLEDLGKLSNLDLLKYMGHLDQLHQTEQLQMLKRLEALENLNKLQNLQTLKDLRLQRLDNLHYLNNMQNLDQLGELRQIQNLDRLQGLENLSRLDQLNRLGFLDRLATLDTHALLLIISFLVPGLIFQEALSFFLYDRLGLKRALVLMLAYNVANLLLCIQWVYPHLNRHALGQNPPQYYALWFFILLLFPFLLGWAAAALTKGSRAGQWLKNMVPTQAVTSAWDRFLTEAERYQVTITLHNEEKIRGIFQKGVPVPENADPSDLHFTETAHYDPRATEWKKLEQPADIWVKGSEIKVLEVIPQA